MSIVVRPVDGLPEIRTGDDLAGLLAERLLELADGDIVVVSSKVVSKAEGRIVHGMSRPEAVRRESVRTVASRGETAITQTRHGFVMAAAGVDNSNVEAGALVLLPTDPDGSARALRAELARRLGVRVGVVVTDTFGRPWRLGQTDLAIGAAGVLALDTFRGQVDRYGNELAVTAPAYADELAAAADLVKAKLAQRPVAVIRGLERLVTADDGPGVAALVRPAEEDMFRLGAREAHQDGMRAAARLPAPTVDELADDLVDVPIDLATVRRVVAEFSPGSGRPWRYVEVEEVRERKPLLDALGLPSHVPYLLAVHVDDPDPAVLLELGAALDRLSLALTVEGCAAIRLPAPDGAGRLAVIAVGAQKPR